MELNVVSYFLVSGTGKKCSQGNLHPMIACRNLNLLDLLYTLYACAHVQVQERSRSTPSYLHDRDLAEANDRMPRTFFIKTL